MPSLIQEIAAEMFRSGKSLNALLELAVGDERAAVLEAAKRGLRGGADAEVLRRVLIDDEKLPWSLAMEIVSDAERTVAKEKAASALFAKATLTAIDLFRNHVAKNDVISALLSEGCSRGVAEDIARDQEHHYR